MEVDKYPDDYLGLYSFIKSITGNPNKDQVKIKRIT